MKKVFFAAIAAMVMVSVSNVFASNKMMGNSSAAPVDTVAPTTPTDLLLQIHQLLHKQALRMTPQSRKRLQRRIPKLQ